MSVSNWKERSGRVQQQARSWLVSWVNAGVRGVDEAGVLCVYLVRGTGMTARMSILQRLAGRARGEPKGTVRVVDPNPLNWLYITYNTVEEPVRITKRGKVRPAAMSSFRWRDDRTLEIRVRGGERFADGTTLDAESVRHSFNEQIRWLAPHPPGTHFNIDQRTRAEVVDDRTMRLHLPEVEGLVLGKLRATHVMDERFWRDLGFGYARDQTGEGHF